MNDWQDMTTAPRDGSTIRVRRIVLNDLMYDGFAEWRTIHFPFQPGIEAHDATGWMYPKGSVDKRVPEPTQWKPK